MSFSCDPLGTTLKAVATGFSRRGLPQTDGTLGVPGLHDRVGVIRDRWARGRLAELFGEVALESGLEFVRRLEGLEVGAGGIAGAGARDIELAHAMAVQPPGHRPAGTVGEPTA